MCMPPHHPVHVAVAIEIDVRMPNRPERPYTCVAWRIPCPFAWVQSPGCKLLTIATPVAPAGLACLGPPLAGVQPRSLPHKGTKGT